MFGKKDSLLGLDIGSHSIKLVQLNTASSPPKLMNIGLSQMSGEAFVEGRVNRSELIAKSIQQLASHLKIKDKYAASSISGYEVMIKKIDMPSMTEDELGNRMQVELGQYIPYNIDEVDVDYQILDLSKDRPNYMEVLLVAAKKESVSEYANMVRGGGLEPVVIDVDFFALSNAFEAAYGINNDESIALLDIGANKAIMNIVLRGVPIFTRGISIGGAQITDRIRDHFDLSHEEAERVKLGESSLKLNATELEEIFVSTVRKWLAEFKRAVDFYYSNFPDHRIAKVYLSGGSCRIAGLDQAFRDHMNLEVEIFNPLRQVEYDDKVFDPDYIDYVGPQTAIAFGLALRKAN